MSYVIDIHALQTASNMRKLFQVIDEQVTHGSAESLKDFFGRLFRNNLELLTYNKVEDYSYLKTTMFYKLDYPIRTVQGDRAQLSLIHFPIVMEFLISNYGSIIFLKSLAPTEEFTNREYIQWISLHFENGMMENVSKQVGLYGLLFGGHYRRRNMVAIEFLDGLDKLHP
jgi:hypothetical protein